MKTTTQNRLKLTLTAFVVRAPMVVALDLVSAVYMVVLVGARVGVAVVVLFFWAGAESILFLQQDLSIE